MSHDDKLCLIDPCQDCIEEAEEREDERHIDEIAHRAMDKLEAVAAYWDKVYRLLGEK